MACDPISEINMRGLALTVALPTKLLLVSLDGSAIVGALLLLLEEEEELLVVSVVVVVVVVVVGVVVVVVVVVVVGVGGSSIVFGRSLLPHPPSLWS